MSAEPHKDEFGDEGFESRFVQDRLNQLDSSLMDELQSDERFSSGVPNEQRTNALDFIQMTGLTRPSSAMEMPAPSPESLNPTEPVSFYERGVADVDHTVGPAAMESPHQTNGSDVLHTPQESTSPPPSASVDAFKDIIADLTGEQPSQEPPHSEAPVELPSPIEPEFEKDFSTQGETSALGGLEASAPPVAPTPPSAPESPEYAAGDDFDQLLESNEPASSVAMPPLAGANAQLAEAEQLLHELEQQPREEYQQPLTPMKQTPSQYEAIPPYTARPQRPEAGTEASMSGDFAADPDYIYSGVATQQHSPRHSRWRRKTLRRLMAVTVAVALLATMAAAIFIWIIPFIQGSESHIEQAQQSLQAGNFADAAKSFERHAGSAGLSGQEQAQAYFDAASALYRLAIQGDAKTGRDNMNKALEKFQYFVTNYASDPNVFQANQFMGIILYKLGNYGLAIDLLKDSVGLAGESYKDLPVLRTLARAYRDNRNFSDAESTYLQVAAHPENYSSEVDYEELGDMFHLRATDLQDAAETERLQQRALEYWSNALMVPGINPVKREEIARKVNFTKKALQGDL